MTGDPRRREVSSTVAVDEIISAGTGRASRWSNIRLATDNFSSVLRKNHRHTGMDLRDELIRLACDNRASAHPLPRFGIFPVFPESGKGAIVYDISTVQQQGVSCSARIATLRVQPRSPHDTDALEI
jgi:hypothetical protein